MKAFLIIVTLLHISVTLPAQQRAQFTQYMVNPFVLNPALAGTEEYTDIKAGFRKQWMGFKGGPITYYITAHTPIGRPKLNKTGSSRFQRKNWHGLGTYLYNDITGATTRTGGYLSYAFNMRVTSLIRVAVGAFGGFQQFKIDGNKFTLYDEKDNVLNGVHKIMVPDAILGTWIYSDKFHIGLSAHQLFKNKITLGQALLRLKDEGELELHYFLTTGYAFELDDLVIIPSIMVKYVSPSPISVDLNTKFNYKNGLLWTGFSYRSFDSFSIIAGITLLDGLMPLSYSYDLTNSKLIQYQTGTHEIVIGYRISPKPIINCPANFW